MRRSTSKFKFALLGLSLFLVGRLAGAETTNRGVLSVQDVEIGAAGEFSVSSATVSGASCQGQMTNHHSGLVEFAASSCSGSFSSRVNQKRSGLKMGSFRLIRSFLDETYFDVFSTAAICPSSSQTYNYLLARARTPDAGLDFSSSSAFAAGVVTYDPTSGSLTGNQRWSLENTADPTAFTYNKRSASCSNGKLVVTKTSESPSVFDTSAIAYFTSNYGFWKSSTGNYQAGVLMPQQSLDAQVLSSKKSQAYAGMYTHYYKKWLETRKFIYAAPNNAAGTEFKIYEASDPADFSQATEFGVLNCSELNAPAPGFCRGTFSRAGISGTGKALCLFGDNFSGQDVWFCEAQTPDSNSSYHLKTLSTFQFQTTSRAKLAVISPEFVNLEANESSRQITVTVTNPSSRPATIAPASVAPSDVQMPSSFSGAQTTFFQNGSQCGTVLAPFSSCQFTINFNPSEQKVVADYLRVSYDKGDGTGAVNATAVFQAAKGLTGISLNAPSSVTLGESMAVTTTATFSNGQTQDISQLVNKSVSDRAIASVSNTQNAVTVTGTIAGATTVSSTFGSFSAQKEVTVVNPPVAPLNFTATATNGTTIQLSWTAGALNQKHQIAYAIGSVPANCTTDTVISANTVGQALSQTLTQLVSGSTYHFKLCGVNGSEKLSTPVQASATTPVIGIDLIATNGQVLNGSTTYANITVPNGVTLFIEPSFSGLIGNVVVESGGILTASPNCNPSADSFNLGRAKRGLDLKLAGNLTVQAGGLVTMDGKGHPGGGNGPGHNGSRAHGTSHFGYGAIGAGLHYAPTENCYHTWRAGGGGGYGTPGASGASQGGAGGSSFGASDFDTKMYCGSGGGGAACWDQGGKGGGAIYIEANNMTVAGTVSAQGTKPSVQGGGGSGGTVILNASGDITLTGSVTTRGGVNGTSSNIGGLGRVKFTANAISNTGSIVGIVHDAVPFITTEPTAVAAPEGRPAEFSVVAGVYDRSTPRYQWQVSTDGGVNFNDIAEATGSSYSIPSASMGQNNSRYRVRVSASGVPQFGGPSSMNSSSVILTVLPPGTVEYLVVGGGGGGGGVIGGGGGGGGVLTGSKVLNTGELALVQVGQGGAGGWSWNSEAQAGQPGWSSRFSNNDPSVGAFNLGKTASQWDFTALGGGHGGTHGGADGRTLGQSGASAGGSGNNLTVVAGTPGQGNAGGGGDGNRGGGGGGAGGAGETRGASGGNGGPGVMVSITGVTSCYGAGGGGGTRSGHGSGGTGGCSGVGGNGGTTDWSRSAGHGASNTGSGGGGGGHNGSWNGSVQSAGSGGSGVVVIASAGQPLASISSGLTYTLDTSSRPGFWIYRFTAGSGTITK